MGVCNEVTTRAATTVRPTIAAMVHLRARSTPSCSRSLIAPSFPGITWLTGCPLSRSQRRCAGLDYPVRLASKPRVWPRRPKGMRLPRLPGIIQIRPRLDRVKGSLVSDLESADLLEAALVGDVAP